MSDRYIDFANSAFGHRLVSAIGLPSPVRLERWQAGRLRPVEGALLLGGGALAAKGSSRLSGARPRITRCALLSRFFSNGWKNSRSCLSWSVCCKSLASNTTALSLGPCPGIHADAANGSGP